MESFAPDLLIDTGLRSHGNPANFRQISAACNSMGAGLPLNIRLRRRN